MTKYKSYINKLNKTVNYSLNLNKTKWNETIK